MVAPRRPEADQEAVSAKRALKAALAAARRVTVASFDYHDENGAVLFTVKRLEWRNPDGSFVLWKGKHYKEFRQEHIGPDGKLIDNIQGVRRVVYRLPKVLRAIAAGQPIFIVEGEAKADLLCSWGLTATCCPMGAGKWSDDHTPFFTGAEAILVPDHDGPGSKHANDVAIALHGVARSFRLLELPDLPPTGDVINWHNAGGTKEEFLKLAAAAPEAQFDETPAEAAPDKPTGLIFERMADVEPEAVQWIWPNRIARGKLTLVAGDPGVGKSQITIDVAARITTSGAWPDGVGSAPSGSVVILSAEDSAKDTLRPRFDAAGADPNRVHTLKAVITTNGKHRTFSLQADLDALGEKVREIGDATAVIIDPITSYMGEIDSHRTTDVRAVLEPVAAFAEQFNVGVVAVTHPPKATQTKALHAITGSLAFVAAARLVFIAIEEPETSSGRRLLLAVKNNLGPPAAGLGFHLVQCTIGGDKNIVASHVAWDSTPVTITANEALAAAGAGNTARALGEAMDFLCEELAAGPRPVKEIKASASGAGIAQRTLRRAQEKLHIKPQKAGLNEGWLWGLPKDNKPPYRNTDDRYEDTD